MENNIFFKNLAPLQKNHRLLEYYNLEKFTDCTFILNKDNRSEIKAHKLILASSSPVFETMFFGDLAQSEIEISDIHLDVFKLVLDYIYNEEISIKSVLDAWSFYYVANKYQLEHLSQTCKDYIRNNLSISTLALSYEHAEMYELHDIRTTCFIDMQKYFKGLFHQNDYHMKGSTLSAILDKNSYTIDSYDLIVNLIKWAETEVQLNSNLEIVTSNNVISVLKKNKLLRYCDRQNLLELKCNNCGDALIMCDNCDSGLLQAVLCELDETLTDTISNNNTQTSYHQLARFRKAYKIATRLDLTPSEDVVSICSVSQKIMLFGFFVGSEMQPPSSSKFALSYEGTIAVRVCKINCCEALAKATVVSGQLYYDYDCCVMLKDLVVLEPGVDYEIRVSYGSPDRRLHPVHCYYMSNSLSAGGSKEAVVKFYEMLGSVVKGIVFYPA